MASETWSAILSGWPSPTDSEAKRKVLSEEARFQSMVLGVERGGCRCRDSDLSDVLLERL